MADVTAQEVVLLPSGAADRLRSWTAHWGTLDYQYDTVEGVLVVTGSSNADKLRVGTDAFSWSDEHYLHLPAMHAGGLWYDAHAEVVQLNLYLRATGGAVQPSALQGLVVEGWKAPPIYEKQLVVTRTVVEHEAVFAAWAVCADEASPLALEVVTDIPICDWLAPNWPVGELRDVHVVLVGCGSIGSTIARRIASAGVGRVSLVDPDRLLERNVVRHELSRRHLGRHKVTALAEELAVRYPDLAIDAVTRDAVTEADFVRPLIAESDIVVCATDGVESRRVVNHLARRATRPAVFACVLEDGAFGEIVRVRPGTACLACARRASVEQGAIDPESGIDLGYGTGTRHRPMTAVPTDLVLVADLAAKATLATLLRSRGYGDQLLAGDHAIVALRPVPDRPPPFDMDRCGDVRWEQLGASYEDCVTCGNP